MKPQAQARAARDEALKAAFTRMGTEGLTALEIQRLTGQGNRETVRTTLEELVHARVVLVERKPRDNRYRPAPNWEEGFDAYIRARDARLRVPVATVTEEVDDDGEPAPGVPLVQLAQQRMPFLHTVWRAQASQGAAA